MYSQKTEIVEYIYIFFNRVKLNVSTNIFYSILLYISIQIVKNAKYK